MPGTISEAVAGIAAERRVVERGHEGRLRVVLRVVVAEHRVARADVERQARLHLERVVHVELEVLPARLRLAEAEGLGEAPGHVLEQEVAQDVAGVRAPAVEAGRAPERRVLRRAVAVRVLVLGVRAREEPGLEEVLAEDGRVVVLQDVEVLVVAEGRLVPERLVAAAAPEERVSGLVAVLLVRERVDRRDRLQELGVQARRALRAVDDDLVAGVGEGDRVDALRADVVVQLDHQRLGRLVPVRVDRREGVVTPQVACSGSASCSSTSPACSAPSGGWCC